MSLSKDELMDRFHNYSELYEHLANLHEKTDILCREIFDNGVEGVELKELRLAEIFSLYNTAKLFLSIKADLYNQEYASLLNFWNEAYYQIYAVVRENDQNTSWMHERYTNYSKQYEIVENIFKSRIEELKSMLQ